MNEHAKALGRLGGLANKGKPKSQSHKQALSKVLESARKRTTLTLDASKPNSATQIPKPETKRCQASFCNNVGREVIVAGCKAWLCEAHGCPPYTRL